MLIGHAPDRILNLFTDLGWNGLTCRRVNRHADSVDVILVRLLGMGLRFIVHGSSLAEPLLEPLALPQQGPVHVSREVHLETPILPQHGRRESLLPIRHRRVAWEDASPLVTVVSIDSTHATNLSR